MATDDCLPCMDRETVGLRRFSFDRPSKRYKGLKTSETGSNCAIIRELSILKIPYARLPSSLCFWRLSFGSFPFTFTFERTPGAPPTLTSEMEREADITIFGATGFTGAFIARRLAKEAAKKKGLRYALAGRSAAKLNALVAELKSEGLKAPTFIGIGDVSDEASLVAIAQRSRVLINATGPYRFFGPPVVKSCIAAGCHYVDITGEPAFMESMVNEHDQEARRTGTLVVNACAFDSIPADFGALSAAHLLRKGGFVPTQVVAYLGLKSTHPAGIGGHYATFESAVHGVGSTADLAAIRKAYARKNPETAVVPSYGGRPLACADGKVLKKPFFFSNEVGLWVVPFPGSDASVVRRTQRSLLQLQLQGQGQVPIAFSTFATVPSTYAFVLMLLYGLVFSLLAKFSWGRKILLAHPKLFSNGVFSHEGPSPEQIKQTSFTYRFVAVGHKAEEAALVLANPKSKKTKSADAAAATQGSGASDVKLPPATARAVLEIQGSEPGYDATSAIVTAAAISLLQNRGSLPAGGVFTPGVLFRPGTAAGDQLMAETADCLRFVTLEEPKVVAVGTGSGGSSGSSGHNNKRA